MNENKETKTDENSLEEGRIATAKLLIFGETFSRIQDIIIDRSKNDTEKVWAIKYLLLDKIHFCNDVESNQELLNEVEENVTEVFEKHQGAGLVDLIKNRN